MLFIYLFVHCVRDSCRTVILKCTKDGKYKKRLQNLSFGREIVNIPLFIYLFWEKFHRYWEDAGYSQVSIFYYYYYFLWPPSDRKFKLSEERNVCLPSASYVIEKPCSPRTCVNVIIKLANLERLKFFHKHLMRIFN